jgi:hypothetical protein
MQCSLDVNLDLHNKPIGEMILQIKRAFNLEGVGRLRLAALAGTAAVFLAGTAMAGQAVLIAGGNDNSGAYLKSAELYNISNGHFSATGSMHSTHQWGTMTVLEDGTVLVEGGDDDTGRV